MYVVDTEEKPKKKVKKNPTVDTSFLPDKEREEAERKEREKLKEEWLAQQEKIKRTPIWGLLFRQISSS